MISFAARLACGAQRKTCVIVMILTSKACSMSVVAAGTASGTPAHAQCVHRADRAEGRGGTLPFPPEAVEVNVEIGGRTEALDERHGAGVGLNPFQSGLFDQKGRDDSVNDLKYAGNQLRMGGQQDAQRVCEDHE